MKEKINKISKALYLPVSWYLCIFCKLPICVHAHFPIRIFTFVLVDLKAALSIRDGMLYVLQMFGMVCLRKGKYLNKAGALAG